MTKTEILIKHIDPAYHKILDFREQIFALYVSGTTQNNETGLVKIIRTHLMTCAPSSANLDINNPNNDTSIAYETIDALIEQHGVRGFFHTHPTGCYDFSAQDMRVIRSQAIANGKRFLWYGVQAIDYVRSRWLCASMVGGQVFIQDMGWHSFDIEDPIILLPLPAQIEYDGKSFRI